MAVQENMIIQDLRRQTRLQQRIIDKLRIEVKEKKLIINGLGQEYKSNWRSKQHKFDQLSERTLELMQRHIGTWLENTHIVKFIRARYPYYKDASIRRNLRKMREDNLLIVKRNSKGTPSYHLNLKVKPDDYAESKENPF